MNRMRIYGNWSSQNVLSQKGKPKTGVHEGFRGGCGHYGHCIMFPTTTTQTHTHTRNMVAKYIEDLKVLFKITSMSNNKGYLLRSNLI